MTSPQESYTDMIRRLIGAMPINAGAYSDDLNRAWIAAQQQQGAAALQAATQVQLQNQTNQMRMIELMGGQTNPVDASHPPILTDAAQRWRSELQSQSDVQNERLRQEYAQMLGYTTDANGNSTGNQTLSGRQQTLAEQTAAQQNAQRMAELTGYAPGGSTTLAREQFLDSQQQQYARNALQLQMAREQQSATLGLQQGQQGWQSGESAADRAARLGLQREQNTWQSGERLGTQAFQGQESAYERQLRQAMQAAEFGQQTAMQQGQFGQQTSERLGTQAWQSGESAAERAARLALQESQQTWQSGESAQERQLRLQLQSGQLGQQEAEFARTYLLQQQEGRRAQAALAGYTDDGNLTEAARAARAGETTQRAQLAAQLLNAPKDVFRAGAFFRELNGGNQANMGFGGGGISGFNSLGNRLQGTGGTLTPGDVYGAVGGATQPGGQAMSAQITAPQAEGATPGVPEVPANASGANSPSPTGLSDLWGGGGAGSAAGATEAAAAPAEATTAAPAVTPPPEDEAAPGSEPAGPVEDNLSAMMAAQLGGLGLNNALTRGTSRSSKGREAIMRALERRGQGKSDALPAAAQAAALQQLQAQAVAPTGGANPLAAALGTQPPAANPQLEAMRQLLGGAGAPQNVPALPPVAQLPAQAALMQSPMGGAGQPAANPILPQTASPVAQAAVAAAGAPPAAQAATTGIPLGGAADSAVDSAISSVTGAPAAPQNAASLGGLGLETGGGAAAQAPGATQAAATGLGMGTVGAAGKQRGMKDDQGPSFATPPGMGPGGPVGGDAASLVQAGLGDLGLGMNAGGQFPGRVPPDQQGLASAPEAPIPYVDQSVLQDPEVKAMFDDMRQQGLRQAAAAKKGQRNARKASKAGPDAEGGLSPMTDKLASGQAASNERYLRGLSRMMQKGTLPGMGPAGPVDAPLFPENGTAAMPELQDAGSLGGGGASFAAPTAGGSPTSLDGLGLGASSGIGSVDPYQQAQAMDAMNQKLMGGVGNWGPQELEKMSATQRGLAEGAAGAAAINWDDLEEAYAQTRFANTGNALLA